MLAVWVVGGMLAMCGALSLAEVASALPKTGGIYVFLREGWGRLPAFLFGWAELVIIRAAAIGAIAITFAEYFLRVLGYDPLVAPYDSYARYTAAAAIVLTSIFNIVGIRWSAMVTAATTLAKYGGLLFVILLAFSIELPKTGGHFTPFFPPGSFSLAPFGLALVSVLWAFDGWADLTFAGGEVKDGERNLPRAIILGSLAVLFIYLLANLAYLSVLPIEQIRTSKLVAADVGQRVMGPIGVAFVAITVMLSTFGSLNSTMLANPRVFFAMAEDGLFFKPMAAVHPRFRTPVNAIALAAVRGPRRRVRDGDPAVLRVRRRGDLRAPPTPRILTGIPDARVSTGSDPVHSRDAVPAGERGHRPRHALADDRGVRGDRGGHSGLLRDRRQKARTSRRLSERGGRNGVKPRAFVVAVAVLGVHGSSGVWGDGRHEQCGATGR